MGLKLVVLGLKKPYIGLRVGGKQCSVGIKQLVKDPKIL